MRREKQIRGTIWPQENLGRRQQKIPKRNLIAFQESSVELDFYI